MSGILSGLEGMGFQNLDRFSVFEEDANDGKKNNNAKLGGKGEEVELSPEEYERSVILEKTYHCPICDADFHTKQLKTGKVKLETTDTDLRPRYHIVDCIKYDAIVCPECGYGALTRFFTYATSMQTKLVRENITANFTGLPSTGDIYSYDEAILRYKMALMSAIVKKGKNSEKAYTCLKLAWLCRGKAESLDQDEIHYRERLMRCKVQELEYLGNAYEGFAMAFTKEAFPICGMDELTLEYLMADLARRMGKYEEASRWVSRVLTSRTKNPRIKDKARELKEFLVTKLHDKEQKG